MNVQPINNNPSFGALKISAEAEQTLKKCYKDRYVKYVRNFEKDLENTKIFDLEVECIGDELNYYITHKKDIRWSSEGPLYPFELNGKTIIACGRDLLDCADHVPYVLKYPSAAEANKAYRSLSLKEEYMGKPLRNTERLCIFEWAVESVKMLDKYFKKY